METKEILRSYVSDMLAVEKHCLESIERQTREERLISFTDAYDLLTKIERTLRKHTVTLDQCLSTLDGGAESLVKKAATSAMGAISGLYGMIRPDDPISRSLRDDYTALSLAAISYTMLHTTACALNESSVSDLAIQHLNELTPLIVALSRVIPEVVAKELAGEGKVADASVWQQAVANTQKAWSSEVIGQYH
jgi:ferritin-like metal-binding protein YciE